jgi:A/G-specific adenine glycosylase
VFISDEGETILEQRRGKGIWEGLYEFPLVETSKEIALENLVEETGFQEYAHKEISVPSLFNESPIIHKLSHQHIHTRFWIVNCDRLPQKGIPLKRMRNYPVPRLIDKFIETYDF